MSAARLSWDAFMAAFDAALAAEETYLREVYRPAYVTEDAGGPTIPDDVDGQYTRLMDERCDAEDALVATPAPDLARAIWKIEYARPRWSAMDDWPDDWWAAVMGDLHRLAGIDDTDARSNWEAARSRYETALTAERGYVAANYPPELEDLPIGPERSALVAAIPEHILVEANLLDEVRADAQDALIACPAPDAAAMVYKMAAICHDDYGAASPHEQIADEIMRFAGSEVWS